MLLPVRIPVRAIRSSFKQVKNLFLYQWTYIFIALFSTLAENFLFIIIPLLPIFSSIHYSFSDFLHH